MENKIKVTHNAGFYSNCTIRLKDIINFVNKFKSYPNVDSSEQWIYYKDDQNDITNVFFRDKTDKGEFLISEYMDFNESVENQFHSYKNLNYKCLTDLINKYFEPTPEITDIADQLVKKYNLNFEKIIGVCYRGNDKHKETNLPSHDEMIEKIIELRSENPDFQLLIQSDEIDFYESVIKKFPDAIYIQEILKMKKNWNSPIQYHIPIGHRVNQAKIFHAILLILSKCEKIILNSGNVGMWICLYRANFKGVHQYLNQKEYIYGELNPNYNIYENRWIE